MREELAKYFPEAAKKSEQAALNACFRKITYITREAAEDAIYTHSNTEGSYSYRCWNCSKWHTGRPYGKNKAK